MTESEKNSLKKVYEEKNVKIARKNPDNIRPIYVNDLLITHTDNEFYLTFSVLEPAILDPNESLESFESIDAIARAKIVVTPDFADKMNKTISVNVEKYFERLKTNGQPIKQE